MQHLWEAAHPYYCNEGNYFANGHHFTADSWSEFYDEFGDADKDMNLVFRWDWKKPDPDDYDIEGEYGEPEIVPDTNTLQVFFMGQRKGYYFSWSVQVTEDDEPAIREYLTGYAEHMRQLWAPLL